MKTPSRATFRIVLGLIFATFSFIISGFVELSMEERVTAYNAAHKTDLTLDNFPKEHQLHMLTIIPQIFAVTCGEVLCVINGMEFAYAYVSLQTNNWQGHQTMIKVSTLFYKP